MKYAFVGQVGNLQADCQSAFRLRLAAMRGAPWTLCLQADEGVGCGPGGPPHDLTLGIQPARICDEPG